MNVSRLMQRNVATASTGDPLDRVARLLRDHDCGGGGVVDAQHHPVAVVTNRDVCLAALRTERPLAAIDVDVDLLAPPVSCAAVGRTLGQIARPRLIEDVAPRRAQ